MTVILGKNLTRIIYLRQCSRTAIFKDFFCRRYSQPKVRANMNEVHIDFNEADNQIIFTLHYSNPALKVNRTFNYARSSMETIQNFLRRIDTSIRTVAMKKVKRKANPDVDVSNIITNDNVKDNKIVLLKGDEEVNGELSCGELLASSEPLKLYIFGEEYEFKYNVPKIVTLKLSSQIFATFPTYPAKLEVKNMSIEKSNFTWYKSEINEKNKMEWINVGTGYIYTPTKQEIGCNLKLAVEPKSDEHIGATVEIISNHPVLAAPSECPFERRQQCTQEKLSGNKFRVVTYNILADMYSESVYSKSVLFPYCPEYALTMDYRKHFILKELMGYKADIICLQEVDKKVFARDLNMILSLSHYKGIYNSKPSVEEGLAIFFDTTRFTEVYSEFSVISEHTDMDGFSEIWAQIQNEKVKEAFLQRPNIVQATVLQSKEDPSKIILVGNTHLYFHPLADNIRLLQAYYAVTYLKQKINEIKKQNPDASVTLVFCGDFNSSPQDGIFKLFTSNHLPADSEDWKSNQEIVEKIPLQQDIQFGSACGTPEYTNYTTIFSGCLDYIFYEQDKLSVDQTVPMPTKEELSQHTAIPSPVFPSDHISLCADLKWIN